MYVLRQVAAHLAAGNVEQLAYAGNVPWRFKDVLPKYALNVEESKISQGQTLANSSSYTVPLPTGYTNTARLACFIQANGGSPVKVTVVSPDHGTSTFMLSPTNSDTLGVHPGIVMWCGTVTSIAVITQSPNEVPVEWFLFELPDLDDADGYRIGQLALGVSG